MIQRGIPEKMRDATYLCGEVQTANAYTLGNVSIAKRKIHWSEEEEAFPCIYLKNTDGEWIGMLRLHSADYFEQKGYDLSKVSYELQLIAISEGSVPNGLDWGHSYIDEYDMEERPSEGPSYEFVNVLWVSWDGTVARREALGRVAKVHWESLGAKTLEVVLG